MSFVDNRVAFHLLGYDAGLNIVKSMSRNGARYLSRIVIDESKSTVDFIGQSDDAVSFSLKELAVE
jgi:hypothetical protein